MRTFDSGAKRDSEQGKLDFDGYFSPQVIESFAKYMQKHQTCADGSTRASSDWKAGIPCDVYMRSAWRHFFAVWKGHHEGKVEIDDINGALFNLMGMAHELLKPRTQGQGGLYQTHMDATAFLTCTLNPLKGA